MTGGIEVRIAETEAEKEAVYRFRYDVYVEEMGRYHATADHSRHRLADPEDDHSCLVYATDGHDVVGSLRVTWGGDGFSARQIEHYQLAPFLAEMPAERMAVGERTMIARAWRGTDLFPILAEASAAFTAERDVRVVFGACEPHLLCFYAQYQRPFGDRNINSPEAGYLIPLVSFPQGPDALVEFGRDGRPPRSVTATLTGTGTVTSAAYVGDDAYLKRAFGDLAQAGASLFDGLTSAELACCLHRSAIVEFRAGDRLLKAGGSARNLFVLLDGQLDVSTEGVTVASLGAGDVVGEMAYLLGEPRTCDVRAASNGRILSLSEGTLRKLPEQNPVVAAKLNAGLARTLCRRLALANEHAKPLLATAG